VEKLAATFLADKETVTDLYLAPDRDDYWSPFNRESFKTAVIVVDVMCPGGNRPAVIWVENDQVGITTDRDSALTRKETKQFRGAGAEGVHKTMQVDTPAIYAIRVH